MVIPMIKTKRPKAAIIFHSYQTLKSVRLLFARLFSSTSTSISRFLIVILGLKVGSNPNAKMDRTGAMKGKLGSLKCCSLFTVLLVGVFLTFASAAHATTYEQTYYDDGDDHFMDVYLESGGTHSFFVNGVPVGSYNYVAYKDTGSGYNEIWSDSTSIGWDPTFSTYVSDGYIVKLVIYDGSWDVKSVYYWYADTEPPTIPSLVSPYNGAETNDSKVYLDWNDSSDSGTGIDYYQVQVDNSSSFSSPEFSAALSSSNTTTLSLSDGLYYWHVRAKDNVGHWSSWSSSRTFRVDTEPPTIPSLVSPYNGAETNDSKVYLDWNDSSDSGTGVAYYQVQVDNSSSFSSPEFDATPSSSNDNTSSLSDGLYYWHVRARDNAGNPSSWSSSRTFRVDQTGPSDPTLVSPSNGAETKDSTLYLDWNDSSDSGTGVAYYQVQVDNSSSFSSPEFDATPSSSNDTTSSLSDGLYYWHVRAKDNVGNWSSWSSSRTFRVDNLAPTTGTITIVDSDGYTNDATPTLEVNSSGADYMRLALTEAGLSSATWVAYQTGYSGFDIRSGGEGSKTIWVEYKDEAGNIQTTHASDATIYDTVAPSSSATAPTYENSTIPIDWTASDATSGVASTQLWYKKADGTWADTGLTAQTGTGGTFLYSPTEGEGTYYFASRSTDNAGNVEAAPSGDGDDSTIYDITPPEPPVITTNEGNDYSTPDSSITLSGTCAADTNGIYVNGSTDGVTYTAGETSWTYTGTLESGENTFEITAEDAAGNVSDVDLITVTVDNFRPDKPDLYLPGDTDEEVSLTPELQTGSFYDPDVDDSHAQTQWQVMREDNDLYVLDITSTSYFTALTVPEFILDEDTSYYWRVRFYDNHSLPSDWSDTYSFRTVFIGDDQDSNGIPDDQEVDSTVDLDGNGTPDINQSDMKCVNTMVGDGQICIKEGTNVGSIESLCSIDPNTISDTENRPDDIPLGLISFKLEVNTAGDIAAVTVYLSEPAPSEVKWYKHDSINGWQDYSAHATFSADRTSVTLVLKDGDYGDADGAANGLIVDPSGPVFAPDADGRATCRVTMEEGCFIGTAAYGSCTTKEAIALRNFRDDVLLTNSLARSLAEFYCKVSPPPAEYIGEHKTLRTVARFSLAPIVYGVKHPKTSVLIFLFAIIAITLTLRTRGSNRF